jgi:predicted secreted hydrolase
MNARALALFCLLLFAPPALAQGFAGMGSSAEGFALPERGTVLAFPRDHGAHPEFRIEWWYLTATLRGADGRDYGIQWTLFRSALAPEMRAGWSSPQIWMGHAGLTTPERHFSAERLARDGIGQAGVRAAPFLAHIDDWQMAGEPGRGIEALRLNARGLDFAYDLALEAEGPLVLHGEGGFSVKSRDGHASYYYSQPTYRVSGTLALPGGPVAVTGQGWLDREWSSQPLSEGQTGWDWFSLVFEDGARMMAFRLRDEGGDFTSGTWIGADGSAEAIPDGRLRLTPLESAEAAGRDIPVRWRLALPERGLDITVRALNSQSWMALSVPYWEGPVQIEGSHRGRGYLEMTGYE